MSTKRFLIGMFEGLKLEKGSGCCVWTIAGWLLFQVSNDTLTDLACIALQQLPGSCRVLCCWAK